MLEASSHPHADEVIDQADLFDDVYFSRSYAGLYCQDGGEVYAFEYEAGEYAFRVLAIKRPLDRVGQAEAPAGVFDLETPYGYGGFITNAPAGAGFVEEALARHKEHALEQGVVAEFVRFHPYSSFPQLHGELLDLCTVDRTAVDVDLSEEDLWMNAFSSSLRRNIRSAPVDELELVETGDYDAFAKAYRATMEAVGADDFYFFEEEYFRALKRLEASRLYGLRYGGKIVNYMSVLEGVPAAYYHLGATLSEYYSLNVNPVLFYRVMQRYQERGEGYRFYLGGGATTASDDSLLRFKKKFSDTTLEYWIGGLVIDEEKYESLLDLWREESGRSEQERVLQYRFV